jgi:hypothetical protein
MLSEIFFFKNSNIKNTHVLLKKKKRKKKKYPAHACNPSHSAGRDQEVRGSKPAQASRDPIWKKTYHKKGLVE